MMLLESSSVQSWKFSKFPQKGKILWRGAGVVVVVGWLVGCYQKRYLKSMADSSTMILIKDLLHSRYPKTQKVESNPQSKLFGYHLLLFILLLVIFCQSKDFSFPLPQFMFFSSKSTTYQKNRQLQFALELNTQHQSA